MSIKYFIATLLISLQALPCDSSRDITRNPDGSYRYTRECHVEAGKAFKKVDLLEDKVALLERNIELKDYQIKLESDRGDLWMKTAMEAEKVIASYEEAYRRDRYYWYGAGVLTAVLSVYLAGRLK